MRYFIIFKGVSIVGWLEFMKPNMFVNLMMLGYRKKHLSQATVLDFLFTPKLDTRLKIYFTIF